MVKHFSKDVEAIVVDYMNGNECKLCGDSFKHKGWDEYRIFEGKNFFISPIKLIAIGFINSKKWGHLGCHAGWGDLKVHELD